MIALLGEDIKIIKKIIEENKLNETGVCEIANDNADGQVIISGDFKSIESFKLLLNEKKNKIYTS